MNDLQTELFNAHQAAQRCQKAARAALNEALEAGAHVPHASRFYRTSLIRLQDKLASSLRVANELEEQLRRAYADSMT